MEWFAHRGAGKGPLENTLTGIQLAFDAGYRSVEFDVMLTADGMPMLHHDWVLGRCAKPIELDDAPKDGVSTQHFFQLTNQQLLAYQVQNEPIPSLEDAVLLCAALGMRMNIELKAFNPHNAIALGRAVQQVLNDFVLNQGLYVHSKPIIISSFYHACLLPIHEWRKDWVHTPTHSMELALLYERLPDDWAIAADALQAESVHLAYCRDALDAFAVVVRRIHTTGRGVRVYTVNHEEDFQRLMDMGVEGGFTDPNQTELAL